MSKILNKILFRKMKIPKDYGDEIKKIYYVIENDRSQVMQEFYSLSEEEKDLIKDLICRMATVQEFKSPKIKYNLKGYNYGEIKPLPHRFFFFQKLEKNIIFFFYAIKKKNQFNDSFYKELNKKKELYEQEFTKFISRNR